MAYTPAVFDPKTMKGQDFTTTKSFDRTVWTNVFINGASTSHSGISFTGGSNGIWITSEQTANSSIIVNPYTNQKNWPQSGFQTAYGGKDAGFGYGTFHWRARSGQKGQGPGVNALMWRGDGGWIDSKYGNQYTEIDVFEAFSADGTSISTLHSYDAAATNGNGQAFHPLKFPAGTDNTSFHDYDVVWGPGTLALYIDGALQYNDTSSHVPKDYAHGDCNRTHGTQVVIQTSNQPLPTMQLFVANAWWSPSLTAPTGGGSPTPTPTPTPTPNPTPTPTASIAVAHPQNLQTGNQSFGVTVTGAFTANKYGATWQNFGTPAAVGSFWSPVTLASGAYSVSVTVDNPNVAGTMFSTDGTTVTRQWSDTPTTGTPVPTPTPTPVPTPTPTPVYTAQNPTIGANSWSFTIPNANITEGTRTVSVTEANNTTVTATSNAFTVSQPTPNPTPTPTPVPPVITVAKPASLYVGPQTFAVKASGAYTKIELIWAGAVQASPPSAFDGSWTTVGANLSVSLTITNPGTLGGLWYRADGGTAYQEWTIAPLVGPSVTVDPIQGTQAGYPVYVTGEYTGTPTGFSYLADTGSFANANVSFFTDASGVGIYSFVIQAGLAAANHTITVAQTNDTSIHGVSQQFTITAATGSPPPLVYPSAQSSAIAPVVRAGFNPNLNVPYSSDDQQSFYLPRDYTNTIALGYAGKGGVAGWRARPSWRATPGSYGYPGALDNTWQVCFRVVMQAKARAGSTTILDVFTNLGSYMIPVGEPLVFWIPGLDGVAVTATTAFPFTGFSFPLKTVFKVLDATSVTLTDSAGKPILDASGKSQTVHKYGIQLPAGTTIPSTLYWDNRAGIAANSLSTPILYARHNSFYVNSVTKQPRSQIKTLLDIGQYQIAQNGGVFIYGGDVGPAPTADYWSERAAFGDAIAFALFAGEMEYVGARIAAFPDLSLVAVELEDAPAGPWTNVVGTVDNGVRDMIVNTLMPGWRTALGPQVTIIAKGTQYGSLSWALAHFDIVFPTDGPYAFAAHLVANQQLYSTFYPDTAHPLASSYDQGGTPINFIFVTDSQYVADALSVMKVRTGAQIVGLTQFGVPYDQTQFGPFPNPPDYAVRSNSNEPYRARMCGSVLSALGTAGQFVVYADLQDNSTAADFFKPDGLSYDGTPDPTTLEMFYPAFRNEAVRANTAAVLSGYVTAPLDPYMPPAVGAVPTFTANAPNAPIALASGASGAGLVLLAASAGYAGTVTISLGTVPAGLTATLSSAAFSNLGTASNACTVALTASSSIALGAYSIPVSATDGTTTITDTVMVQVGQKFATPTFALTPATAAVSVTQGGSSPALALTLTPSGGYTGTNTFSIGNLPTGVVATFSATTLTNGTGSVNLTFAATSTAATGPIALDVVCTDGTITQNCRIALTVVAAIIAPGGLVVTIDPQHPLYTSKTGTFSGTISDPSKSLAINFLTFGMPTASSGGWVTAKVSSNGQWICTPIVIDHPGTTSNVYALVGGATVIRLEAVVPVDPTGNPPPIPVPLVVGRMQVATADGATFTLTSGVVTGGTAPYSYVFNRTTYQDGNPTGSANLPGTGSSVTDTGLAAGTQGGYVLTVSDSSTPVQTIATPMTLVTSGIPSSGPTAVHTLDDLFTILNGSVVPTIQTIAVNAATPLIPSF